MGDRREALALGIGNVLWADEGFGVRAVEALNEAYAFSADVSVVDGGTQGLYLFDLIASARRVLVFDAIDFSLAPGTLAVFRDGDVPAWGAGKMSPHQTGFSDVLALAALRGEAPEKITLVGVQPQELTDLGGSLTDTVKARVAEAVEIGARELAFWGFPGQRRNAGASAAALNAAALALDRYERDRPAAADACRIGDPRVLARRAPSGSG
ncbi:MAG TPA: HyaD/HybD family hydrogenase maturation endopeptidase [Casimicrobiaceae bacterium]|nr:HyaD/HybD family hydrogenase maturation endopeptidase [Casimicrobiaceae bacterium]